MRHPQKLTDTKFLLNNNQEMIASHAPDGVYLFVNDAFLEVTGYTRDELLGKNPYDFFHPEDQETIRKDGHLPSLEGSNGTLVEYRFIVKDGSSRWFQTQTKPIEENGKVIGLITSSRNISSRVNLRSTISEAYELFDESSDMAELGAWEVQKSPMKIFWSKKVYDIYELDYSTEPELVDAISFYVGEDQEKIERHFKATLEDGTPYDLEVRLKSASGNLKWVRTIGRPYYEEGKIVKAYGVIQDVTQAVEDRMRLRDLADHLTRQKLQMEQFNQIVSHNLRSPIANLGVILNYYEESDDMEERAQYISFLKESSRTLQELLNDLVDAVKILNDKDIHQEAINIKAIVGKTCRILALEISNSKACVDIDRLDWNDVNYAPIYMESILMNLVSNAIKYCSEDRAPEIKISALTNENGDKILAVKDNGMGIDIAKHGEKLFKLHTTFARNKSGKGLGLFMTKQQIEAMGGEISVESTLGEGTTFIVNLDKYRFTEQMDNEAMPN